MEQAKTYGIEGNIRPECLQNASIWVPPTSHEIRLALNMAGWSGVEFSKRINTNDRTIRRWLGDDIKIPYTVWCVLCAQANLGLIWK
jgi:hypothetical protein